MSTDSKTPATTKKAARAESYDIAKSDETLDLAKDLAKFIKENKLSTQVQGKEFVNVEGWQYAGSRLGIVPIVEHVINVSTDQELKYQAKVTLFDMRSQHTVGAGFAICSNKESGKKFYQEFAIASMAQTRAIGKAYRNILAWIIRAAGYEPTPAEEMEYTGNVPSMSAAPAPTPAPVAQAETVPMSVSGGGTEPAAAPVAVQYATASQKEEIVRLLEHPLITRQEKTKMLLNINRLDEERATQAIAKLKKTIEDREGTSAIAEPAGNEPAGQTPAQPETPAALPSDAPAASTTSDQSSENEAARIARVSAGFAKASEEFDAHVVKHRAAQADTTEAPTYSSPEVGAIAEQLLQFRSSLDLNQFWDKLTGGQRKELLQLKLAKQQAITAAINAASATASRQNGGAMREVGTNSALVDEFVSQPKVAGASYEPISNDQKEAIIRLLNHGHITLKEKTALLKAAPDLDTERARQALLVVRGAIDTREAAAQQAQVAAFAERSTGEAADEPSLQVA